MAHVAEMRGQPAYFSSLQRMASLSLYFQVSLFLFSFFREVLHEVMNETSAIMSRVGIQSTALLRFS